MKFLFFACTVTQAHVCKVFSTTENTEITEKPFLKSLCALW
jgi:hypothetical protein